MSKTAVLLTLLVLSPTVARSQIVEIRTQPSAAAGAIADPEAPIEFFGRGLTEMHFTGQVEASTQILKIRIGEPNGFSIPLYLLTGATNTVFGDGEPSEATIADLTSATGGFLNGSFNGDLPLFQSQSTITQIRLGMMGGVRLLSGRPQTSGDVTLFGAGYLDGGIIFQTAAWADDGDYEEGGVFWIQLKYAGTAAPEATLREIFGEQVEEPHGVRADLGILIKDRVNVKLGAFLPQQSSGVAGMDRTTFRVALDYKVAR
jgi:hypothetical protein